MKLSFTVLMALGALYSGSLKAQNTPITIKGDTVLIQTRKVLGFGPEGNSSTAFGSKDMNNSDEEYLAYPTIKNIPPELTGVKEFFYPVNRFQFIFQSYKAGKITKPGLLKKAENYGWNLADTTTLSKKYLACYINAAVGKNKDGDDAIIIDLNNNGDYADDKIMSLKPRQESEEQMLAWSVSVSTESMQNGKVVKSSVPVCPAGALFSQRGMLSLAFPEFSYQKFAFNGIDYVLCVSAGYTGKPFVAILADRPYFDRVSGSKRVFENQYVKLDNADFKIAKINREAAQVTLVGTESAQFNIKAEAGMSKQAVARTSAKMLTSFSTGYLAPPIKGLNMNRYFTKYSDVSLASLKGKFVFVDFWATYCGPCIAEMPYLAKAYEKYPRDKFEIIGVFNETDAKITEKLMRDNFVSWPNILQHAKTSNVSGYGLVNSYPTTLLINPEGKIVAKDLRGEQLAAKLDELLNANVKD